MNSKVLLAFAGGLIVASGVTYFAMKQETPAPVETAKTSTPAPVATTQDNPSPAAAEPAPLTPPADLQPTGEQPKPSPGAGRRHREKAAAHRAPENPKPVETPAPVITAPAPAAPVAPSTPPAPPQEVAKVEPPPRYETAPPPPPPPPPQPHTVTIPLGTNFNVRLSETLSTERNQPGDQFTAVLDQPLVVEGFVIAERGARVHGRIVELERSGKVKGLARLSIELTQLRTSDGQDVRIRTSAFEKQADPTREKDAAKVGGGAVLGAIIGAIAGGGKGAAIGAGAGGAAGAGDVMMTRGKPAELRVETKVSFRLSEALTITEKLQ